MTEVQFAKQFLTTIDSKPTKYQADHVFDPKTFHIRVPYTLPKLSNPPHPQLSKSQPAAAPIPGSQPVVPTVDITLRSNRNPTFTLNLPSLPSTTPMSTLRTQVQSLLSQAASPSPVALEKIKILYNKKPIPSTKPSIHDVLSDTPGSKPPQTLELGVMVMGGAPDPKPTIQTLNLNNDIEASTKDVGPESEKAAAEAVEAHGARGARLEKTKSPDPVQPGEISGREVLKTPEFWDDLQGFLEQRLRSSEVAVEVREVFEKAVRQ